MAGAVADRTVGRLRAGGARVLVPDPAPKPRADMLAPLLTLELDQVMGTPAAHP